MAFASRLVVGSRISALVAAFVSVPAFSTAAAAAQPEAHEPGAATSVPEPSGDAGTISADTTVPEPTVPSPETSPAQPAPSDAAPAEPAAPAVDPSLLDAREPEDTTAVRPVATQASGRSLEEQLAVLDDAYAARYRPPDNPLRLNVTGRLMFANISGRDRVNGRMGGGAIDIGPSWNRVGIAGTVTGWAGRVLLAEGSEAEMNAMIGGGLTAGLGRLALLSHGYLDLRVGYDVFYGVVNRRAEALPGVTDGAVVVEPAQSLVPHGPRARLDIGLVGAGNRRYFHGFGLSIGYQALVAGPRESLPFTNMLTLGLSYWMG